MICFDVAHYETIRRELVDARTRHAHRRKRFEQDGDAENAQKADLCYQDCEAALQAILKENKR